MHCVYTPLHLWYLTLSHFTITTHKPINFIHLPQVFPCWRLHNIHSTSTPRKYIWCTEGGESNWLFIVLWITAVARNTCALTCTHTRAHKQWIIDSNQSPHNRTYLSLSHEALVERWALVGQWKQAEVLRDYYKAENQSTLKCKHKASKKSIQSHCNQIL